MAYREVTMIEVKEVLRQWLSGRFRRAIARFVGLDRNTVRHYIRVGQACGMNEQEGVASLTDERLLKVAMFLRADPVRPPGEAWTKCHEHRDEIARLIKNRLRLTKVRKLLLRQGIEISYPTLHRFASSELGFGRGAPTIPVADCDPGEELQVDTGWMGLLEPDERGKRRRFRAFIFTAVRSRHRFVYPTFRETTAEAIEACEAAWIFYQGVFRVLVPDNCKAIVTRADPLDPLLNPAFLEYAQARGFVIDPTRVRSPKDKGRVERAVPSTRDDCFAGERLRTLEDARRRAREWCINDYGMRRHSTTQRLPLEQFEAEEKEKLLPAPTEPYDVPIFADPKVARDQYATVAKALYSLPRVFVGKKLRARADRTIVRFYDAGILVKTHPRKPPGGRSTDPADFPPEQAACARRDVAFFERSAATHGLAVGRFASALLAGPLPWTRMRRVYALLGLCRRFGDARVEEACERALAAEMIDVKRLERMLKLAAPTPPPHPTAPRSAKVIPLCRYLRPPSQYALPLAPRETESPDKGDNKP